MKVVEVFETRPHKAVSIVVERGKEIQEWSAARLQRRKVAREEHKS